MSEIKVKKIKNLIPKKVLKIILWVLIGFIMIRGVVSMIRPDQSEELYAKLKEEINISLDKTSYQEETGSFAEGFVREFLTYKQGSGEEYKTRVAKYMSEQSVSSINTSVTSDLSVIDTSVIRTTIIDESRFNIDVRAKVIYPDGISKDLYLTVPVTRSDNQYVVEDLPLFIPGPSKASIEPKKITGTMADTKISNEIKDTLYKFLRVYSEGQKGEITYYLADSNIDLGSLGGTLKFKDISEVSAYSLEENRYTVEVSFTLIDQQNNQEMKQRATLGVIYKNGKYYIESFDTRAKNKGE